MNTRIALANALVLGLTVAACGGGQTSETPPPAPVTTVAPVPTTLSAASRCTVETPLAANPAALRQMEWKDGTGVATGADPQALFGVPSTGNVCGVRLRFTLVTRDGTPAFFQAFWATPGEPFSEAAGSWGTTVESGSPQSLVVWTQGNIDRIRIDPDNKPVDFKLTEITLLSAPAP